jgi:muramoyltetrapeptide carboxypeptidase
VKNDRKMITPDYLTKGDKLVIVAPAGKIAGEKITIATQTLESWGLDVVLGDNLFNDHFQYAAADDERLADLQQALDDDSIKAILFARGGYGVIRILDQLNFSDFLKNPKWLIGFSDITILHCHIQTNFKIESLHASMAAGLSDVGSAKSVKNALFGESLRYELESNPLSRKGKATGILTGGNLAILCSLIGSASDIDTKGKILFIEDVGEYLYRLDRMMWQLKRAGKLSHLAGMIVGGMTEMKDGETAFGKTPYEIVSEAVREYDYPVYFGFPGGHLDDNRALILGRNLNLNVDDISTLNFQH